MGALIEEAGSQDRASAVSPMPVVPSDGVRTAGGSKLGLGTM